MKKMIIPAAVFLSLVSCTTLKEKPVDKTVEIKQELPEERTAKQKDPRIYSQPGKDTWVWTHETKGEDEFLVDQGECKPSRTLVDTYLTEKEKNLPVRYYILMLSATNKCMVSKGWKTVKQKTGEEEQQ